ncbi:hypothetical protein Landi51_06231 [Colletotrichum acutatum]
MAAVPPGSSSHAAFADFIASDPELPVFRSFQALSARNLLHLQSKMLEIEAELQNFDEDDAGWFDSEQPFLGQGHDLPSKRDDFIALAPSSGADFLTRNLEDLAGRYLAFEPGETTQGNNRSKILLRPSRHPPRHNNHRPRRLPRNPSRRRHPLPRPQRSPTPLYDRRLHQRLRGQLSRHDGRAKDGYHPGDGGLCGGAGGFCRAGLRPHLSMETADADLVEGVTLWVRLEMGERAPAGPAPSTRAHPRRWEHSKKNVLVWVGNMDHLDYDDGGGGSSGRSGWQ